MKSKKRRRISNKAPLATLLVQPVVSLVVKGISGRRVRRVWRGYLNKNF